MKIFLENEPLMRATVAESEKFYIGYTPNYEPVVEYKNGKKVVLEWGDILNIVENAIKEPKENKEEVKKESKK